MTFPVRDPDVATRKIYFYHVDVGRDPEDNTRLELDAAEALRPLADLDFASGEAYDESEEHVTCGWLDRHDRPTRLRVADIRRTNLPQIEASGNLAPLAIDDNAGLAEQVHVQFFPGNIAGSDFNFYGPRMSRVSRYLRTKAGLNVRFMPAVRGSVIEQLRQLDGIRLFQLRVHPTLLDELDRVDTSVAEMFRAASRFGDAEQLEVILKPARYSRDSLPGRVKDTLLRLVRNRAVMDGADVFKTAGVTGDGERRVLDLLSDDLRVTRSVRRLGDGSRALDPHSVYHAIESAYEELRAELEIAHGIWMEVGHGDTNTTT